MRRFGSRFWEYKCHVDGDMCVVAFQLGRFSIKPIANGVDCCCNQPANDSVLGKYETDSENVVRFHFFNCEMA